MLPPSEETHEQQLKLWHLKRHFCSDCLLEELLDLWRVLVLLGCLGFVLLVEDFPEVLGHQVRPLGAAVVPLQILHWGETWHRWRSLDRTQQEVHWLQVSEPGVTTVSRLATVNRGRTAGHMLCSVKFVLIEIFTAWSDQQQVHCKETSFSTEKLH